MLLEQLQHAKQQQADAEGAHQEECERLTHELEAAKRQLQRAKKVAAATEADVEETVKGLRARVEKEAQGRSHHEAES